MHPIASYARTAYAMGWAASGGPMTDRVKAGCVAAVENAIENADYPDILEATLRLGHLEGVWASIFQRRDELYAEHVTHVLDAWKKLVKGLDLSDAVRAVKHYAGVTEARKDRNQAVAAYAAKLVLAQLMTVMTKGQWLELRNAVTAALNSGLAEGQTGAMALLADKIGAEEFDWDKAYADALRDFGPNNPFTAAVDNWLGQLMDLVATAIGNSIADAIDDGEDPDEAADDELEDPDTAVTLHIDSLIHMTISAGILWFYRGNGVGSIWFITVGDEKVCQQCDDAEADSPYQIIDLPTPPLHPRCRCSLYTDEPMSADLIAGYLV